MNDSDVKSTALMDRKSLDSIKEKKVSLEKEALNLEKKGGAFFVILHGPKAGDVVYIDKSVLVVGRDDSSDIVDKQDMVSRKHAKIVTSGRDVSITDLGSTNGTLVNNKPINTVTLKDGDEIQMGNLIIQFFQEELLGELPQQAGTPEKNEGISDFYKIVFQECEPFFGENTKQFLDRQIVAHVKKTPHSVDFADIQELSKWIKISGSLYLDSDISDDLANRIMMKGNP